MPDTKNLRHWRKQIEDLGGTIERQIDGKHVKFYVRTSYGQPRVIVIGRSGANGCFERNRMAELRRLLG